MIYPELTLYGISSSCVLQVEPQELLLLYLLHPQPLMIVLQSLVQKLILIIREPENVLDLVILYMPFDLEILFQTIIGNPTLVNLHRLFSSSWDVRLVKEDVP